jgi:hypothetical protein
VSTDSETVSVGITDGGQTWSGAVMAGDGTCYVITDDGSRSVTNTLAASQGCQPSLVAAPKPSAAQVSPSSATVAESPAAGTNAVTVTVSGSPSHVGGNSVSKVVVENLGSANEDVYCALAALSSPGATFAEPIEWMGMLPPYGHAKVGGFTGQGDDTYGGQGKRPVATPGSFLGLTDIHCYYDSSGLTWTIGGNAPPNVGSISNNTDGALRVTCMGSGDGWPGAKLFHGVVSANSSQVYHYPQPDAGIESCTDKVVTEILNPSAISDACSTLQDAAGGGEYNRTAVARDCLNGQLPSVSMKSCHQIDWGAAGSSIRAVLYCPNGRPPKRA